MLPLISGTTYEEQKPSLCQAHFADIDQRDLKMEQNHYDDLQNALPSRDGITHKQTVLQSSQIKL